jgi:hypothetical protein
MSKRKNKKQKKNSFLQRRLYLYLANKTCSIRLTENTFQTYWHEIISVDNFYIIDNDGHLHKYDDPKVRGQLKRFLECEI